jgi:O-methyltransferase domain/Dimerisation domain
MPLQPRAQAAAALRQIALGLRASQALYVAAKLNIADHLAQGPLDADKLSKVAEVDAAAVGRVMRALCSLDVFAQSPTGKFSLNSTAELLRSDVPDSYRAAVLFSVGEVRWRCWSDLLGTVRAGGGGAERTLGMSLFDFYAAHPEESQIHDQSMRATSVAQVAAIVGAFGFSQAGVVIDVGGGTGELLAAVLAANPSLRGTLFDLPHVVAHARSVFTDHGVMDRQQTMGGSFFESVPAGGNTYVLKTVIHSWDDTRATAILANCRRAMTAGGKLIIIERELPEIGEPGQTAEAFLLDLEMLVMTPGGRERTRREFARLLSDTQFKLARIIPTTAPVSIFEADAV